MNHLLAPTPEFTSLDRRPARQDTTRATATAKRAKRDKRAQLVQSRPKSVMATSSSSSNTRLSTKEWLPLYMVASALMVILASHPAAQAISQGGVPQVPGAVPASVVSSLVSPPQTSIEQDCQAQGGFVSFELITGYVLSAPADSMTMQPGTLQLVDCLNICRNNQSCLAINFETGLCVMLQESADKNPTALQKSQFPVFTIYAHKICLQGDRTNRCHKSWSFERVIGWVLNNLEKRALQTKTRLECLQACYNEQSFQCRSFNYDSASGACSLSDMDRHSLPGTQMRKRHYVESTIDTVDYGENNCIQEPKTLCDFKQLNNRILKTVDSIYQDIKTQEDCRQKCLQAPYRCHSYDLGDASNPVCRTSHLDRNSLQQIQDPYLEIAGAVSYELESCYNITIVCKSREMIAKVKTNKIFNGKIYAKNAPISCMNDITNSMDFEITMAFNDACAIQKHPQGKFSNDIVLQHNDMIVTNQDLGLNVRCQYDLRNQTVYNNINLDADDWIHDRLDSVASQSAIVKSPNITMHIMGADGGQIKSASVGDSLVLRFQITDDKSPFEIFVRDLYAMDGVGGTEILLIDAEGCPTDPSIMNAMQNVKGNGQVLEAQFDAFKFPTSETVAFRALVTPCVPSCEPVHCQNKIYDGTIYDTESYGKRKRRKRSASLGASAKANVIGPANSNNNNNNGSTTTKSVTPEEVVVRNSIEITDKFNFLNGDNKKGDASKQSAVSMKSTAYELDSFKTESCMQISGVALLFCLFLIGQSLLIAGWVCVYRRQLKPYSMSSPPPSSASSTISVRSGLVHTHHHQNNGHNSHHQHHHHHQQQQQQQSQKPHHKHDNHQLLSNMAMANNSSSISLQNQKRPLGGRQAQQSPRSTCGPKTLGPYGNLIEGQCYSPMSRSSPSQSGPETQQQALFQGNEILYS